ncbi:unnamed protein product [Cuscuta epithymum]
MVMVY